MVVFGVLLTDNVEIILRWTETVDKFLSYQRISTEVLRNYLYKKKLPISATDSKKLLVERVKDLWIDPPVIKAEYQ